VHVRSGETLRLRFAELDATTIAAVLRLDPIGDREEYAELVSHLRDGGSSITSFDELAERGDAARALVARARNLGVDRWGLWARDSGHSVVRDLEEGDWRCLVVDVGSLETHEEQALVSDAVLATLWRLRHRREPLLLVVDEAHNVCPGAPEGELLTEATEHAVRIAGEGRKFGVYLLVATQRPEKVHDNVVSQCDNLLLMRMNSDADVAALERTFSFVPPSLLRRATTFRQGEALVAGKIAPHATLVRFGSRITEEGGSDVPADWAARRS
jgi:DNA helicase HerA-like ATPase